MEIVKLQEKELRLKAEAKKLEKDADDASNKAEVERDFALVAASNALRNKCKEKLIELEKVNSKVAEKKRSYSLFETFLVAEVL